MSTTTIINKNSYYELDKLINIVKSFNGKIFGDLVKKYYINTLFNNSNDIDINDLNVNIIFEDEMINRRFIRILNQHYELYKDLKTIDKNIMSYYLVLHYINNDEHNPKIIKLNIFNNNNTIINNYYISKLRNNIDINLLAINEQNLPLGFQIFPAYPNPFNPSTTISYQLPNISDVKISVFDLLGNEVAVLSNERKTSGKYNIQWHGIDRFGKSVSSGTYFVVLEALKQRKVQKILLIK